MSVEYSTMYNAIQWETDDLTESFEHWAKYLAIFIPIYSILGSNPVRINFTIHPPGMNKIPAGGWWNLK